MKTLIKGDLLRPPSDSQVIEREDPWCQPSLFGSDKWIKSQSSSPIRCSSQSSTLSRITSSPVRECTILASPKLRSTTSSSDQQISLSQIQPPEDVIMVIRCLGKGGKTYIKIPVNSPVNTPSSVRSLDKDVIEIETSNESNDPSLCTLLNSSSSFPEEPPEEPSSDLDEPSVKQNPRKRKGEEDLYTPRVIRFKGVNREGRCELCPKHPWLRLKNSLYWAHMQFKHGIDSKTGQSFPPPAQLGIESLSGCGLCGTCDNWVQTGKPSYNRPYGAMWFRHIASCLHSRATNSNKIDEEHEQGPNKRRRRNIDR